MAKLKVTFMHSGTTLDKDDIWVLDHADKKISAETAQKAINQLKEIQHLKKTNGEPLYGDIKGIRVEVLEESVLLTVENN